MLTAKPWGITNLEELPDGSYRFTIVKMDSGGPTTIRGSRYNPKAKMKLMMPAFRQGNHYYPIVVLSRNNRKCVQRLVEKGIALLEARKQEEARDALLIDP